MAEPTTQLQGVLNPALGDTWRKIQDLKLERSFAIDGDNLDLASVVATARHGLCPQVRDDARLRDRLQQSIDTLHHHLQRGYVVYGVNTGFGGSADSRTEHFKNLQISLLQHTQSAIISRSDKESEQVDRNGQSHIVPRDWVRAAILARANQNLRGHSGVRLEVIQKLLLLLRHDITPLVPLRGTISASGDLMPLSYIAGSLAGSPDVLVRLGPHASNSVVPAKTALNMYNIHPVDLAPKEGLGLINGTAPSAAVAALVIHEAQQLAFLAQSLTAFTAECLCGNVEWANAFIHATRPHPGQCEAAQNIRTFLEGSSFVVGLGKKRRTGEGLWQDRYSTRTAPQWIGPYLEDLLQAQRQVEIELNSTSDNPIIDGGNGADGEVYSGGNFQATAVTSALDKTRSAVVMIGRMLFSQCTELIHPAFNNGLDPNLVFGDPENSYTMKGIDVNMSAYMSELAALASPVSAHVQSAEMHNQGINSLAFLSARRTMEAVDILAHMSACHAYICCQAIDLRDYHRRFLAAHSSFEGLEKISPGFGKETHGDLYEGLRKMLTQVWYEANKTNHIDRCQYVASRLGSHILSMLAHLDLESGSLGQVRAFETALCGDMKAWVTNSDNDPGSLAKSDSAPHSGLGLGRGSSVLYATLRRQLGVEFHRGLRGKGDKSIGSEASKVYEAIRDEVFIDSLMKDFIGWNMEQGEGRSMHVHLRL